MQNVTKKHSLVPVILAGGSGTRLWPASRQLRPKPFIRLESGGTLFGKTLDQIESLDVDKIITIVNEKHYFLCDDIFKQSKIIQSKNNYLLEPFGRNTAPAIYLAAKHVSEHLSNDSILLVLSADHLIDDSKSFQNAINEAVKLAEEGLIVTFGIEPNSPSTGFGYIGYNKKTKRVTSFKEKPDIDTAKEYIKSEYLWNAGIFCFKVETILQEFEQLNSEQWQKLEKCNAQLNQKNNNTWLIPVNEFSEVMDISIDYAILEKSKNVAVVPCSIGWSDIGSWNAFSQLSDVDELNNSKTARTIHVGSNNVFVRNISTNRLVTTIGVTDLLIIDTPDALLVAHKDHDQDVKKLVEEVKIRDREKVEFHQTVNRPWGTYTVLEEDPCYKIKRIVVKPGESLSLQMHHHRSEHWIVVSGIAKVVNGTEEILIHPNESTYIPAGQTHRLTNPGVIDCILIEVQVGSYLGEDDIVRFTDIYGRQ